jgi:hypothetical protein
MPQQLDGRVAPQAVNLRVCGRLEARAAFDFADARGYVRRL